MLFNDANELPADTLARHLLTADPFSILAADPSWGETRDLVRAATLDAIGRLVGAEARAQVAEAGLEKMHRFVPAHHVEAIRQHLHATCDEAIYAWACRVARSKLGLLGEFHFDEKVYYRINLPFEVARRSKDPRESAKRRLRRLAGKLRRPRDLRMELGERWRNLLARQGFVRTYDLERYNRGLPKATWSHGPHIDTWYGHSYDAINYWWSIAGVNQMNAMVIYPKCFGYALDFDPRSMYLAAGQAVPEPYRYSLDDGDLLLFNAELLHSTQLNLSDETRFVITTRVNPIRPRFDSKTRHAIYDHWYKASDIERGVFKSSRPDASLYYGKPTVWKGQWPANGITTLTVAASLQPGEARDVAAANVLTPGGVMRVAFANRTLLLYRLADGGYACTGSHCPHVGIDLGDGFFDGQRMSCPGHGALFDVRDGSSPCNSLKLRTYKAYAEGGRVWISDERQSRAAA